MNPPHDLALFDFDGTLANSLPWAFEAMQRLAAEFKYKPLSTEKLDALRNRESSSLVAEFNLPRWKMPRLVTAVRRLMAAEIDQIALFDGVETFFERARARGLRLGIVSSNSEANVRTILGPSNAAHFACFECGVSVFGKAVKLRRAARHASTPVQRAIYIGDELRDLDAAESTGMTFGAVTWGWADTRAFRRRKAPVIFSDFREMENYLLNGKATKIS